MQISEMINDITQNDITNIDVNRLVALAQDKFVVMTFDQWKQITTQRSDTEKYIAIHSLLIQLTYLGFVQNPDDPSIFYVCIFTGVDVPRNFTDKWTRITDLRIATTHTANLPWIVFRTSTVLDNVTATFVQNFFNFITKGYVNQNITVYALTPRDTEIGTEVTEITWYWMHASIMDTVPKDIPVYTLMPIPGRENTVLIIDRANNTLRFTVDTKTNKLIKLDEPRTVL